MDGETADGPTWPEEGFRATFAASAERIAAGHEPRMVIRELLDELQLATPRRRQTAMVEVPALVGQPWDALLGGLAEWIAVRDDLVRPEWTFRPERFLDRLWFATTTPGLRAEALVGTPAALRRRGLCYPERSLRRV